MKSGLFSKLLAIKVGSSELGLGHKNGAEELVFITDPFQALGEFLCLRTTFFQVVNLAVGKHVVESAITFLKHSTCLVARHFLVPDHVDGGGAGGKDGLHALLYDVHPDEIAGLGQSVAYAPRSTVAKLKLHQHSAVAFHDRSEEKFAGVKALCCRSEDKSVGVGAGSYGTHFGGVVAVVLLEGGTRNGTALVGNFKSELVVLEFNGCAVAREMACKAAVANHICKSLLEFANSQCRSGTWH